MPSITALNAAIASGSATLIYAVTVTSTSRRSAAPEDNKVAATRASWRSGFDTSHVPCAQALSTCLRRTRPRPQMVVKAVGNDDKFEAQVRNKFLFTCVAPGFITTNHIVHKIFECKADLMMNKPPGNSFFNGFPSLSCSTRRAALAAETKRRAAWPCSPSSMSSRQAASGRAASGRAVRRPSLIFCRWVQEGGQRVL